MAGKSIRVTARALILHRGHVLFLHAVEPGREFFFLPGGGVAHGETMAAACEREVLEETGLTVRATRPLFLREFIAARHEHRAAFMPEDQHIMALIFLCGLTPQDAHMEPAQLGRFRRDRGAPSVQGLRWLPVGEISGYEIHPPHLKTALASGFSDGLVFWPEE